MEKVFCLHSKEKTNKLHDELYWSSAGTKGKWAIRSGDWKLVAEKNRIELFDLKKDISETTNLAATYPKVVSELTKQIQHLARRNGRPDKQAGTTLES